MNHILTINVEDYFQVGAFSHLIPYREWERFEDRMTRNLAATLTLLAAHNATATFFVSGWIAENHAEIFQPILKAGHEIGAQGYYQQSIRGIPPLAFRDDVRRSKQLIEAAIGHEVLGFRIGRGWIGPDDLWALDTIHGEGFRYDASICPIGRQFAGEHNSFMVDRPGRPSSALIEIPISSLPILGYALPFAGGNYLRQLPEWLTRRAIAHWVLTLQRPLVAYFHIWELDENQPGITAASSLQKIRHYRNLNLMPGRVAAMLSDYRFTSVREFLALAEPGVATRQEVTAEPLPLIRTPRINSKLQGQSITLIVPCYNEEASIAYLARTLAEFEAEAGLQGLSVAYVFVDDGSIDSTWQKLEKNFGDRANVTLTRLSENKGIAAGIIAGANEAKTDLVLSCT